jgi:hypothetical protein
VQDIKPNERCEFFLHQSQVREDKKEVDYSFIGEKCPLIETKQAHNNLHTEMHLYVQKKTPKENKIKLKI